MNQTDFHQCQKYSGVKHTVDSMRTAEKVRILEIGTGSCSYLNQILPHDDLTFLSLLQSQETQEPSTFTFADEALCTFENESFDFVVAPDVLRYIRVEKWTKAIGDMLRIAKEAVFFTFPSPRLANRGFSAILGAEYEALGFSQPKWIGEYSDHNLPAAQSLSDLLPQDFSEENVMVFSAADTTLLRKMLQLELVCKKFPRAHRFFDAINDRYVQKIAAHDMQSGVESGAKTCVLLCKQAGFASKQKGFFLQDEKNASMVNDFIEEIVRFESQCLPIIVNEHEKDRKEHFYASTPELSVLLVTYNQSTYIEKTVHSILIQETSFPYEIVIADDCSSDDTRDKIRNVLEKATIPFRFLESKENVGVLKNYQRGFAACEAPFVAVIEGDDLWTDPCRLQKHVDCLKQHLECTMSANRIIIANYEACRFSISPVLKDEQKESKFYIFGEDLARENVISNFSSCVYRTSCVRALPKDLYEMEAYDWLFNIVLAGQGPIAHIPEVMSVYREHSAGTWGHLTQQEKLENMMTVIRSYDAYTKGVYHEAFEEHFSRLKAIRLRLMGKNASPKSLKYKLRRLAHIAYACMPPIVPMLARLFISPALLKKILVMLGTRKKEV